MTSAVIWSRWTPPTSTTVRFVEIRSLGDSGRSGWPGLVEGAVAEHGEQDVDPASGQAEEGLGVPLALVDLLVVVGA